MIRRVYPWIIFIAYMSLLVFSTTLVAKRIDWLLWPIRFGLIAGLSLFVLWSRWRHRNDRPTAKDAAHKDSADRFIHHPGLSGPFGALMDEYARAAEDFCRVVESFDLRRFDAERPSNNPNTISPRAICLHVIGAAHRYAHYIRKARGVDFIERYEANPARLHSPRDVRGLLTEGIALAEQTVEPLLKATEEEIQALSFAVRWGPRYDPEMILEHAVCHLLRHRRQLERW